MTAPDSPAFSKLLSGLTGRTVRCAQTTTAKLIKQPIFGTYTNVAGDSTMVVRIEAPLLGLFAGCLLALPDDQAMKNAGEAKIEESLRDAMHEVLNIIASPLSKDERVILRSMVRSAAELNEAASKVQQKPKAQFHFNVFVNDKPLGAFSVLG